MALHAGDVLVRLSDKQRFRLVAKLTERDSATAPPNVAVMVALDTNKLRFYKWSLAETLSKIADGFLVVQEETKTAVDITDASDAERRLTKRRRDLIERVNKVGPAIFESGERGALAEEFANEGYASKPFFYTALRLHFQGGGGEASVFPRYDRCGAKGRLRIQSEDGPKVGRPRELLPGPGLKLTEIHRKRINLACAKKVSKCQGNELVRARYRWMLIKYYPDEIEIVAEQPYAKSMSEPTSLLDGGKPPDIQVINYDSVPSFGTFRYHHDRIISKRTRELRKLKARKFDLQYRVQLKGTLSEVDGPGHRYFIDATVLDVYAVSRFHRRRIIGRPTLYLVVDEFTRMIVGMYVGLEPPCWVGALLALYNCCIDKKQFCATYGVDIESWQWPTGGIPTHLMGDRGEHIAEGNDALVTAFDIVLDTAAPYNAAAKSVGERAFGVIQQPFGPFLPGHVDKNFLGREFEPAALSAALDILEITRAMIYAVLDANIRIISEYPFTKEQGAAEVPSQPLALWHWSVDELRYSYRRFHPDYLKRHLWPKAKVTAKRRKALRFMKGLYYFGESMSQQDWYFDLMKDGSSFSVAYHPLELDSMVLIGPGRTGSFQVDMAEHSRRRFAGASLSEVESMRKCARRNDECEAWRTAPLRAQYQQGVVETVAAGVRATQAQADGSVSKAQLLTSIGQNRQDEIQRMYAEVAGVDAEKWVAPGPGVVESATQIATDEKVRNLIARRRAAQTGDPTSSS